jgi:rhodanese-related sulfurtransferase
MRFVWGDGLRVFIILMVSLGLGFASVEMGKRFFPRWYEALLEPLKKRELSPAIREVSLPELLVAMENQNTVVLDARDNAFFAMGRIPGALNLSRRNFESDLEKVGMKAPDWAKRQVIVYCSGLDCEDSKKVAEKLLQLGIANVAIFTEGWEVWQETGQEIER